MNFTFLIKNCKIIKLIFVFLFFGSTKIFCNPATIQVSFIPEISELTSKNPLFKQYSQDVELSYKNLALQKEIILFFYKYQVTQEDTLLSIAARCNIPFETIATLNRISSIHENIQGKEIFLPTAPGIFVAENPENTIEKIISCRSFETTEKMCYTLEKGIFYFLENEKLSSTERIFFLNDKIQSPLPTGILSSDYGLRISPITGKNLFHNGIDLAAKLNTPILACLTGTVVECGYSNVYGNYVVILHDNNIKSFYAHLSSFACQKDTIVSTGEVIGYVGVTGLTTGPHLHFEIYVSGETKDPLDFIN